MNVNPGPWAIRRQDLEAELTAARGALEAARSGAVSRPPEPGPRRSGAVAVVPVQGLLTRRRSLLSAVTGAATYDALADAFRALAADEDVAAVVLEVDSPGGDALGLAEVADALRALGAVKPTTAVVRGAALSGAYAIASAAKRVVVAREAVTGSIGVVLTILDTRERDRAEGVELVEVVASQSPRKLPDPQTDAGRAQLQAEVDAIAQTFIETVARNRGTSPERVERDFGRGAVFVGDQAVKAGLADAVGTLSSELAALGVAGGGSPAPPPAPAPASTWEDVEAAATREAARDALREGEPGQAGRGEADRYLGQLRAAGLEPGEASALVRGDAQAAERTGLPTLAHVLGASRARRREYLADAEAEEERNAQAAPGVAPSGSDSGRRVGALVGAARRLGLASEETP